jgi:hypothetical protein
MSCDTPFRCPELPHPSGHDQYAHGLRSARADGVRLGMGYWNKSIMLGRGPAPGVELRVAIQVVRRRLGNEFREPAESELSAGVTSPPVSEVRGLPLTPDDFLR